MAVEATTKFVTTSVVNEIKITGDEKFKLLSSDFIISPLEANADLYINSIYHGVVNPKKVATIKAGEYTKISGMCTGIEMYLDTTETFYIKQF